MTVAAGRVILVWIPWRISETTRALRGSFRAYELMNPRANVGPNAAMAIRMCSSSQNVNHDHMSGTSLNAERMERARSGKVHHRWRQGEASARGDDSSAPGTGVGGGVGLGALPRMDARRVQ